MWRDRRACHRTGYLSTFDRCCDICLERTMSGVMTFDSLVSPKNRWGSLLVLVFLLSSGLAVAEGLSPQQRLAFDIYKELIEINTVPATGDTARAAEAMAARLRAAGFPQGKDHALSSEPH